MQIFVDGKYTNSPVELFLSLAEVTSVLKALRISGAEAVSEKRKIVFLRIMREDLEAGTAAYENENSATAGAT